MKYTICFLLSLSLISIAFSLPIDFDWTNRPVAVRLNAAELSGKQPAAFISAGHPISIKVSAESISINTYLDKSMLGYDYALRIQGEQVNFLINKKTVNSKPVLGSDGIYNYISSQYLTAGINMIELTNSAGTVPKLDSIEMFALLSPDETDYFYEIFGKGPIVMVQPPSDNNQLKFDILHYDLNHIITMTSSVITANLTMIAKCTTASLNTVVLDLDNNSGNFSVNSVDRGAGTATLSYSTTTSRVFITMPSILGTNSIFTVRLFYSGMPHLDSNKPYTYAYQASTHGASIPIVYSFSEPYGARDWWPCKDVPDDKATMDSHWTCPTTYFAVSNGKLLSLITSGNNHTFNYSEAFPIASYLVSIACTNYKYSYGIYTSQDLSSTMVVGGYIYPEWYATESSGVAGTIKLIDLFAKKFGEYPFLSEKYVTATYMDYDNAPSMEHQTATSIHRKGLAGGGFDSTNVHELSHSWFGDKITMQHFNYLWLNEGFGKYCEPLWQEGFYGMDSYHRYINAWSPSDAIPIVCDNADSFNYSVVYLKGAWVLHMLRHVVSDSTFFPAMKNYATDTALAYGNAVIADFQHHVEQAIGGSTSMSWFFDEWLYQAPRPYYNWSCWTTKSISTTMLNIQITQTQATSSYIMPIDFRVYFSPSGNTTITIWNTQKPAQNFQIPLGIGYTVSSVTFDPENWVLEYKNLSTIIPSAVPVELSRFEAIIPNRKLQE